jgi:hypothetical protein
MNPRLTPDQSQEFRHCERFPGSSRRSERITAYAEVSVGGARAHGLGGRAWHKIATENLKRPPPIDLHKFQIGFCVRAQLQSCLHGPSAHPCR